MLSNWHVPGVRTTVTWTLVGTVVYAGLSQLVDNPNLELIRKMMEYSIVFYFGTKVGPANGGQ